MKIKACDQLFPNQPVVDNNSFDMNFTIARHVPIALSLTSAADYAHLLTNASKMKKNPTVKVSLNSHAPNLVCELSELVFRQLYNEYHLQEPGKENISAPAAAAAPSQLEDDGHPKPKGPAEKKKKSRVCIVPSMLWMINQLRSTSYTFRALADHPSHSELRTKSNKFREAIINAKRSHWTNYLEDMTATDIWTANKYIQEPVGDGGSPRIPTLTTKNAEGADIKINSSDDKAKIFAKMFFPPPPQPTNEFDNYDYPQPLPKPPSNHSRGPAATHRQNLTIQSSWTGRHSQRGYQTMRASHPTTTNQDLPSYTGPWNILRPVERVYHCGSTQTGEA